jgi:phenylpropionate dioxygenase-like ring-hydroxylating dioxygenase large terminal subunit
MGDPRARASLFPIVDPARIPAQRYYDPDFFRAERERLWPRAWQMACRFEEIPEVGDYVEYRIVDQSILVVRHGSGPRDIKAFHNACPHRATQLAQGWGTFRGRQITCPFHGWRWNIDGSSAFVYARDTFRPDCVIAPDLALRECLVDTWGGCVFINMDRGAPPLRDALDPMPSLLDPLGIADMRVRWWKAVRLKANWKMVQEAFLEGFHVMQTHPQLTMGRPDQYPHEGFDHFSHKNGHSHFQGKPGFIPGVDEDDPVAGTIDYMRVLSETLDAYPLARDVHILEGLRYAVRDPGELNRTFMARLYEHYAGAGMPLPKLEPEAYLRWGGVFFLFPNYFVLPMFGSALIYRSRPDGLDPEGCLFELWAVTLKPAHERAQRARFEGVFDKEDDAWPLIPRQDFSNVERQQRGLHSSGFEATRLSLAYEQGISNMHQELDRYLAR